MFFLLLTISLFLTSFSPQTPARRCGGDYRHFASQLPPPEVTPVQDCVFDGIVESGKVLYRCGYFAARGAVVVVGVGRPVRGCEVSVLLLFVLLFVVVL